MCAHKWTRPLGSGVIVPHVFTAGRGAHGTGKGAGSGVASPPETAQTAARSGGGGGQGSRRARGTPLPSGPGRGCGCPRGGAFEEGIPKSEEVTEKWAACAPAAGETPVQYCAQPTNGVVYFRVFCSLHTLPEELRPYVPLFCSVLTK